MFKKPTHQEVIKRQLEEAEAGLVQAEMNALKYTKTAELRKAEIALLKGHLHGIPHSAPTNLFPMAA